MPCCAPRSRSNCPRCLSRNACQEPFRDRIDNNLSKLASNNPGGSPNGRVYRNVSDACSLAIQGAVENATAHAARGSCQGQHTQTRSARVNHRAGDSTGKGSCGSAPEEAAPSIEFDGSTDHAPSQGPRNRGDDVAVSINDGQRIVS